MRYPDPNSKSKRITFSPNSKTRVEDELISEDFKKLCLQDGISEHDLAKECFLLGFIVHHWPPGNPQLTLETSLVPKKKSVISEKCQGKKCSQDAAIILTKLATGKDLKLCRNCFSNIPMRYDRKIWLVKEMFK